VFLRDTSNPYRSASSDALVVGQQNSLWPGEESYELISMDEITVSKLYLGFEHKFAVCLFYLDR